MLKFALGFVFALLAGSALADNELHFAPPAGWVKPLETPKPSAEDSKVAARKLLEDFQTNFSKTAIEFYSENVTQIQTSEGLEALGNIALNWNPDTDTLTVHKLHIIRGGQIIDVLANGHGFTVLRRETDLELAVLDGTLTATIQPEGLQIGDIVDLAYTVKQQDPVTSGHAGITFPRPFFPVDRYRVRVIWPESKQIRWQETKGIDPPKLLPTPAGKELAVDMTNIQTITPPSGAPARYADIGRLEISDYASWGDVSAMMAPLFQKAELVAPDSPIKAVAAKIKAENPDQKAQAAAALRLVEDNVRYFYVGLDNGGYVPASAEVTWSRRFADCKGKTVLLIALLRELGIDAEPALVSTENGDGLDARLPSPGLFDHVIVRTVIGGKTYWLDGTRAGDRDLDNTPVPGFKWALPVKTSGAMLEKLVVPPSKIPQVETQYRIDLSAGLYVPAPIEIETVYRGDLGVAMQSQLTSNTPADHEKELRAYWKKELSDWIEVKAVDSKYDENTGEERLSLKGLGVVPLTRGRDGRSGMQIPDADLGWKPDFDREAGPNQDAPFAVLYPLFVQSRTIILLPDKGRDFRLYGNDVGKYGRDVDTVIAGRELKRSAKIENGIATVVSSTRSIASEFPFSEVPSAKKSLRDISEVFVYLQTPLNYKPSDKDAAASLDKAEDFMARGWSRERKGDVEGAIADYSKAISLEPDNPQQFVARAGAYLRKGDIGSATKDVEAVDRLAPGKWTSLQAHALIFMQEKQIDKAVEALTRAIDLNPDQPGLYEARGRAYFGTQSNGSALADFREALRIDPRRTDLHRPMAVAYENLKQFDLALAEYDKAIAADPADEMAHYDRGALLVRLGKTDEAIKEYDASISIKPSFNAYLFRAQARPDTEKDKILADINAALKLSAPKDATAWCFVALAYNRAHEPKLAVDAINRAINLNPDNPQLRLQRIGIYQDNHQYDEAVEDIKPWLSKYPENWSLIVQSCWNKALSKHSLDTAVADCNRALSFKADDRVKRFRALALMRLGRFDEAIADFDMLLDRNPNSANDHFGRGIAKLRKHDGIGGRADLAAARSADPKIDAEFADYGIKP
jgi:tetratricopeptide (TPR) repeat protein/transglutaminase-like putative cysteine protease